MAAPILPWAMDGPSEAPAEVPAAKGYRQPPAAFLCPISLEVMSEPYRLVGSQQCYQKDSLLGWLSHGGHTDPMTGLPLKTKEMEFDAELHRQIQLWISGGVEPPSSPAAGPTKVQHKKKHTRSGSLSKVSAALHPKALLDRMLPQLTAKS